MASARSRWLVVAALLALGAGVAFAWRQRALPKTPVAPSTKSLGDDAGPSVVLGASDLLQSVHGGPEDVVRGSRNQN